MEVGLRVVRGPDWEWGNQDGGEGCVGTVVEIGKTGSHSTPDKTVVIQWDVGSRTNYRAGYQGAYDLRVWDNATVGVKHVTFVCDSCKCQDIVGMRWRCESCNDFDLCSQCFMADKHDLSHYFLRFETPNNPSVRVLPRAAMTKTEVKGVFVGAKVVRGHDWDWKDQDGGVGSIGTVTDIRGWENESSRSVANVLWTNGSSNVYRLGHNGKTDLKAVSIVCGGFYYREALPILGNAKKSSVSSNETTPLSDTIFDVGTRVHVAVDESVLREMQEGHGGWNPRMNQCLNSVGVVHRVTERGDVRVQFSGMNQRWTFHPKALRKLPTFTVGQTIQLIDDAEKMKRLQQGHGEWVEDMSLALGKCGKITKVYQDGDLRVTVDGETWTLNPLCCISKSLVQEKPNDANTGQGSAESAHVHLQHQIAKRDKTLAETLLSAVSHGNITVVQEILSQHPNQIDVKLHGKTSLLVAAHQGHLELVQYLISKSARLDVTDDDGDTVLHYAVFGNQPNIVKLLLDIPINVNTRNNVRCTPLHIAVNKQFVNCVRLLLLNGADVNAQDSYGDTALHDAIGKGDSDIIDELTAAPLGDFTLRNNRGFNVLHYSALKGNFRAASRLLARNIGLVNVKKDDGFTALHLASLNGHYQIANMLINEGKCDIDPLNNRNQTPLFLAVSQGHAALIELLIAVGANVGITDGDGDTVLHLACLRLKTTSDEANLTLYPKICQMQQSIAASGAQNSDSLSLAITCYLAQVGCNLSARNRKSKTCEDLVDDETTWAVIKSYSRDSQVPLKISEAQPPVDSGAGAECNSYDGNLHAFTESSECMVCSEVLPRIRFMPCHHEIACYGCARRMKKCLKCSAPIEQKVNAENSPIYESVDQRNLDRIKYLESRVAEMEEAYVCSICMERRRNVAFLCGHGACDKCSATLRTCHMCRKLIARKINLY